MTQNFDSLETAMESRNLDDAKKAFATRHSGKPTKTVKYYEPEELAKMILEEQTDALEPFGSLEEMIKYIREAMAANYVPTTEMTYNNDTKNERKFFHG